MTPLDSDLLLVGRRFDTPYVYVTGTRQTLTHVHPPDDCEGGPCCVHAPSRHPLVNAPTHWHMGETYEDEIMMRICTCGNFHPDPDDLAFIANTRGEANATRLAIHECCGCCA